MPGQSSSDTETLQQDKPWWEEIRGTFRDDPVYDEAMRLGREWRESQPIAEPGEE